MSQDGSTQHEDLELLLIFEVCKSFISSFQRFSNSPRPCMHTSRTSIAVSLHTSSQLHTARTSTQEWNSLTSSHSSFPSSNSLFSSIYFFTFIHSLLFLYFLSFFFFPSYSFIFFLVSSHTHTHAIGFLKYSCLTVQISLADSCPHCLGGGERFYLLAATSSLVW